MTFEYWQNGQIPPSGIDIVSSGTFEYWQNGAMPPALTFALPAAVLVINDSTQAMTSENVTVTFSAATSGAAQRKKRRWFAAYGGLK